MTHWTSLKGQVVDLLGLDQDLLHVPLGLVVFALLAVALRRWDHRFGLALLGLLGLQLLNETFDAVQWVIWTGRIPWAEAARDTFATLALPVIILSVLSVRRHLRGRRAVAAARTESLDPTRQPCP
ncbi:hypothetical protein [Roseicyclus amphidinii]|uniref:hypothetical protein n=1 Tax=Roseicyclus amphidinii TaxID=3034232 RepID=UPI0024E17DD5|nr:hypothetical protein [Roseicyclus sp. Amp-Y-6]